jgi:hypothetical protein
LDIREYRTDMVYWKRTENIRLKVCAVICAALGWWGLIYPDFTLTADSCRVVDENGEAVTDDKSTGAELYRAVLQADREHVVLKSRAVEAIRQWKK